MKLGFEKLIEQNEIEVSDLPRNLQVAISELLDLKSRVLAKANIGQNVTESTIERIKVKDEMIIKEIYDLFEDEEEDDSEEEEETDNDEENEIEENQMSSEEGAMIDRELLSLYNSGVRNITFSKLKNSAPATFEHLWESYHADEENGIVTSNFELLETDINTEEFNLEKL